MRIKPSWSGGPIGTLLAGGFILATAGCQNTISAGKVATASSSSPQAGATVVPTVNPSAVTSAVPVAVQGTTAVTSALTQAAAAAAGNTTATAVIGTANALLSLPTGFLNAFKTQTLIAQATSLTHTYSYAGTSYSVTYESDDNFSPLASWSIKVSGGGFTTTAALITGHISQDGKQGDWTWGGTQFGGQAFSVNWNTDGAGTITVRYTVTGQQQCTLVVQTNGHGSYDCPPQGSGTF